MSTSMECIQRQTMIPPRKRKMLNYDFDVFNCIQIGPPPPLPPMQSRSPLTPSNPPQNETFRRRKSHNKQCQMQKELKQLKVTKSSTNELQLNAQRLTRSQVNRMKRKYDENDSSHPNENTHPQNINSNINESHRIVKSYSPNVKEHGNENESLKDVQTLNHSPLSEIHNNQIVLTTSTTAPINFHQASDNITLTCAMTCNDTATTTTTTTTTPTPTPTPTTPSATRSIPDTSSILPPQNNSNEPNQNVSSKQTSKCQHDRQNLSHVVTTLNFSDNSDSDKVKEKTDETLKNNPKKTSKSALNTASISNNNINLNLDETEKLTSYNAKKPKQLLRQHQMSNKQQKQELQHLERNELNLSTNTWEVRYESGFTDIEYENNQRVYDYTPMQGRLIGRYLQRSKAVKVACDNVGQEVGCEWSDIYEEENLQILHDNDSIFEIKWTPPEGHYARVVARRIVKHGWIMDAVGARDKINIGTWYESKEEAVLAGKYHMRNVFCKRHNSICSKANREHLNCDSSNYIEKCDEDNWSIQWERQQGDHYIGIEVRPV